MCKVIRVGARKGITASISMWSYCPLLLYFFYFLMFGCSFLQVKLIDVLNNHIKISYDTHLYTCPIPPVLTRFGVSSRTCICIITSCVACIARSPFSLANRLSHLIALLLLSFWRLFLFNFSFSLFCFGSRSFVVLIVC